MYKKGYERGKGFSVLDILAQFQATVHNYTKAFSKMCMPLLWSKLQKVKKNMELLPLTIIREQNGIFPKYFQSSVVNLCFEHTDGPLDGILVDSNEAFIIHKFILC